MDSPENGISEIVACGPDEFFVLERDSKAGTEAGYRRLIHIDISQATDVSAMMELPHGDLQKNDFESASPSLIWVFATAD